MAVEIQSIMHVNVNCSRLDASLRFYEEVLGLSSGSHTNPVPQLGEGFGLSGSVRWDAHILQDDRGFGAPGIDLLEWKQPAPVGRPYPDEAMPGLAAARVEVPELRAAMAAAGRLGGGPKAETDPVVRPVSPGVEVPTVDLLDPDGTRLRLVERGTRSRLVGVAVNCRDASRSVDWYARVLGLEERGGPFGADARGRAWSARQLWPSGQDAFAVDLVEWSGASANAGSARPYEQANHLGIYRMAFLVADMQAAHAELQEQGVHCPAPVWLDMGPEIPIDGLWACFFPDPDGSCLELIESPKL